jgi:hypothetical protein
MSCSRANWHSILTINWPRVESPEALGTANLIELPSGKRSP